MSRTLYALAALLLVPAASGADSAEDLSPFYTNASIVNAGNYLPVLAPNTIASVFGANLSLEERGIAPDDLVAGALPHSLGGVRVFVANMPCSLYYVSKGQINFLIPANLRPGEMEFHVVREGVTGPSVRITLADVAPALFQMDATTVVATDAHGRTLTTEKPGRAGNWVILYAAGLGPTDPPQIPDHVATGIAFIQRRAEFQILLNGIPVDKGLVYYAGATPGYAGLYQINVVLPARIDVNPEIRIAVGAAVSPPGVRLLAQ
jgi:uncharacterized protein (TIGR03437 family)